jgi:hypothetical protein
MHKDNISYHAEREEDFKKFAVIPHEQLKLIAESANIIGNQVSVLNTMLRAFEIQTYGGNIKTLADLPEIKVGLKQGK